MILATALHTPSNVLALINDVVRCHTDMVQAVHELKVQMAVVNAQNKHLTERVRVLEDDANKKRVADKKQHEDNQLVFTNTVAALHEMNSALTSRVGLLERITEQQGIAHGKVIEEKRISEELRITNEKRAEEKRAAEVVAGQKSIAVRCVELLKKNAQFPLHQAAIDGDCTEVLDHLIVLKIDVNAKDDGGCTPLHWAATNGDTETVQHLLNRGAGINAKNHGGCTPLQWAESYARSDVVALLKSKGGT